MFYEKALAIVLALFMAVNGGAAGVSADGEPASAAGEFRDNLTKWRSVPVIDGAEDTAALNAAFVSGFTGIDYSVVLGGTVHSGTDTAFERLISGEVDIVMDTTLYPDITDKFDENNFEYAAETVANGKFEIVRPPYTYEVYDYVHIFYDKNTKKQYVIDFIKYILSDEGQASTYLCGFEPIKDVKLPLEKKPPYETLGTGEPRPVNFEKSEKYSNITFAYGNYGADNYEDTSLFLLDGDLTNTALEAEINKWIETEIKEKNLLEEYGYTGVYCNGINGYLEVVITVAYFEDDNYMPDSPVSVWNLKTGERVTRFSDLFYEGTDFIPAVKKAYEQPFYSPFLNLDTEPERFFITDFLVGDLAYDYVQDMFDSETTEDLHKQPINSMTGIMDLTPIWTYYDMTPHFTEAHLNKNTGWGLLYTSNIPAYSTAPKHYEKMREWRIYSSRFLAENEIAARNKLLDKIYNYIENSDVFISYNKSYDDNHFPIDTNVSFTDDGRQALVKTPFGSYYAQEDNPKIKTASDDIRLSDSEKFLGIVDVDFDGTPEWISEKFKIKIYDDEQKLLWEIPIYQPYGGGNYFELHKWQVMKDLKSGKVSGIIYYYSDGKFTALRYETDGKNFEITSNRQYEREAMREQTEKTELSLENTQSVIYTDFALSDAAIEMISGKTEKAFENFYKNQKNYGEKPFGAVLFDEYNAAFFTKESVAFSGEDITPKGFSGEELSVLIDEEMPVVAVSSDETVAIFEYSDGVLARSPLSQKAYSFGVTNSSKYGFAAQFAANDRYDITGQDGEFSDTATKKEYWFYIRNGLLTEYGGREIPIERFIKLPQGKAAISEIEQESGTVTGIIYRYNGIVNINYDVKNHYNPEKIHHFYKTYYYDYKNMNYAPKLEYIEKGEGVYLLSITEEIGILGRNKPSYDMSIPENRTFVE